MNVAPTETPFVAALRRGEPRLVLAIRIGRTSDIVRIAHATGHQGIMVDLEHSTMSADTAATILASAHDLGLTAFVRVPEDDYGVVGRMLDGGADGIIFPRVETADQARRLARACRFPPRGHRSQIAQLPHNMMAPIPAARLNPMMDAATIVKVLIETPLGVENAAEIAAVDGVDIIGIGANDLTAELGVPGQYRDERLVAAAQTVLDAANAVDKLAMIGGISDPEILAEYVGVGMSRFLLTGTDTDLLFDGAKTRAQRWLTWHAAHAASEG
jgi:2-keto-3-deoxy-L-rhamnonate aldolase RhmA